MIAVRGRSASEDLSSDVIASPRAWQRLRQFDHLNREIQ